MPEVLLPLQITSGLPPDACFSSEAARLLAYSEALSAVLNGEAFFNRGSTKPPPELQSYLWFKEDEGRWYSYSGGWVSPYNYDASERRLYVGSLVALETYDGGSPGAVTATSGPAWLEDETFRGRSPMGPGAIPDANPAKTLTVGETFGEGAHTQTVEELAEHSHEPSDDFADFAGFVNPGQPSSYEIGGGSEIARMSNTAVAGESEPMPIIHPVIGCFVIRPSGRLYRTVP